jgi:hypothetical protein
MFSVTSGYAVAQPFSRHLWSGLQNEPMSVCDNALGGIIKRDVSRKRYQTTEKLKERVRNESAEITPAKLCRVSHRARRRIIVCFEHDGVLTDITDK